MSGFIKDWGKLEVEALAKSHRRYSYVVNILKRVLPVLIVVLLIVMFVFSESKDTGGNIVLESDNVEKNELDPSLMENPRFHGVDSRNQPYNIFAKSAYQEGEGKVKLSEISADVSTNSGSWVSLVAETGDYNLLTQYLELVGEVNIFATAADFSGYEIYTSNAKIDVSGNLAQSEENVRVKSDIGDFTATGFKLYIEEERIAFTGPIKLVIYKE